MDDLTRTGDSVGDPLPITAICIVGDKTRCPPGFTPILKATDDGSDADLWKDSAFNIFSRQVRYLAITRDVPDIPKAAISVVTDMCVVRDVDPIPHGFIAIDYTADNKEKSLRKKFLCLRTDPLQSVVDAIGEVVVLNRTKKTPKGFTQAGEVDGAVICFRVVKVPDSFGIKHSASESRLPASSVGVSSANQNPLYPNLLSVTGSEPAKLDASGKVNVFTIKSPFVQKPKGVDGVPFELNPSIAGFSTSDQSRLPDLPAFDIRRLDTPEFQYNFNVERMTLTTTA